MFEQLLFVFIDLLVIAVACRVALKTAEDSKHLIR